MSQEHESNSTSAKPHVIIIGGGFAGLSCALALKHAPVNVTLIDRRNFHLFQPLLYQVATGGLSPANIATPLRKIVSRHKNIRVLLGEVASIDTAGKRIGLNGFHLDYDYLVVATGSTHHYFGNDSWEAHAPGLKTIEDATRIRHQVLKAFELAEREIDPDIVKHFLTFAIVGAGPTGVELAGAISEIARHTLQHEFRTIQPEDARIVLLEHADRVLPPYPDDLSEDARRMLSELGVEVRTGVKVTGITAEQVHVETADGSEILPARTVLWAAGVAGSPLGAKLLGGNSEALAHGGRVRVDEYLALPDHPEVFVVGDLAFALDEKDQPLPGVAPVAAQQGEYVARSIRASQRGEKPKPFRYFDAGMASTIGRGKAVALIFGRPLRGGVAWLAWLFIHLMKLVSFENRVLVFMQWAWNYTTRNRSARLITGADDDTDET